MPHSRPILKTLALLFVLLTVIGPRLSSTSDAAMAVQASVETAQADLLECMEKCIRDEGAAYKGVCKTRCAKIPSAFGNGGPKNSDCMAIYKNCLKGCPKSGKICKKICRKQRMECAG